MSALDERLQRAAAARVLLVASDFDGTLSPIVDDPAAAAPLDRSIAALAALADLPDTHVAVVSGRALDDLRPRVRMPSHVHLVGGHGTEIASLPVATLSSAQVRLRDRIAVALAAIAASASGFIVEQKPGSVAFHYRNADATAADRALEEVRALARDLPGVTIREGRKVAELAVVEGDKGGAIRRLADTIGADAIVYVGDDVTDEDAFAALAPSDLGIKVGPGATRATCRVADPAAVADLLARLRDLRSGRGG